MTACPATAALPSLEDYRLAARAVLDTSVYDYIEGGAGDEITTRANREDLARLMLKPLAMRDVADIDTRWAWRGRTFALPLGFSPTALHRMVTADGEAATARAAAGLGIPFIVSSMCSVSLDEIARQTGGAGLWLQTYLFRDRGVTRELVARAEMLGFEAVVLTVGCPVPGLRDRNLRNRFELPAHVSPAHFRKGEAGDPNNPIHAFQNAEIDAAATWEDVAWLRRVTRLPLIVKGILNPCDVAPSLQCGVEGIIVSNHGGRQLDTSVSSIAALPAIVEDVAGRVPVFADGGFRRGPDALKALALGADAVFMGRPVLWALAAGGEAGLFAMMQVLSRELVNAMQLAGCRDIATLRTEAERLLLWR
jgi:isopentenyl diphosphate isomerase/L-lactate dehydrogenase-like FMN-dependent dehydrogenase